MEDGHSSYASAGVDVEAGYEGVRLMRSDVERTFTPGVLSSIGGFGGLFSGDFCDMEEPILVSGTDGVGTKQRIAQIAGIHNTVGIDCVAMCVNDIVCCGARPLFFLDYIAIGKNDPKKVASLVSGVAEGCVQAGCALIGGETAEHPGTMAADDYDLAGFSVGVVDKKNILKKELVQEGDVVIALPSSGVHSNGYSLVRKVFDIENVDLNANLPEREYSLADILLTPTRIYVKPVLALLDAVEVHGVGHITGGGFYENIPRILPEGMSAHIDRSAIRIPEVFTLIAETGNIPERDMFSTFNMGIGMIVAVPKAVANKAIEVLKAQGEDAYVVGHIETGDVPVVIE